MHVGSAELENFAQKMHIGIDWASLLLTIVLHMQREACLKNWSLADKTVKGLVEEKSILTKKAQTEGMVYTWSWVVSFEAWEKQNLCCPTSSLPL